MKNKGIKQRLIIIAAASVSVAVFIAAFEFCLGCPAKAGKTTLPDKDYVKIMNVGQADSILIYSNGYSAIIDAGLPSYSKDIFADLNYSKIKRIDTAILTHYHSDHVGAINKISERFNIRNLILPAFTEGGEGLELVNSAKKNIIGNKGKVYTATPGMNFNIGDFEITVLCHYYNMGNINDTSIVVMAKIGTVKFLFTGDAEENAETALLKENINLDCTVLKVGHHGSDTSTSEDFLKAATPEYSVISVGEDNVYSHPSNETLALLESFDSKVFRTDQNGDVTFFVKNNKITVETEK